MPVMFRGERLHDIERAIPEGMTPHMLRHTAIARAVIDPRLGIELAAEYLDAPPATIRTTCCHHSPHHQGGVLAALERRR